ncbi:MAG: ribonuclease HII [Candidatus Aenigmatarchaeota archaeon]
MLVLGIDEAGRGACIGPLVIAGVVIDEKDEQRLKKMGVKDSKLLTPRQRERIAKEIEKVAKDIIIQKIGACKIDNYRREGINLNQVEAIKMADIINLTKPDIAYLDSPDPKPEKFGKFVEKMVRYDVKILSSNFAERRWVAVAAASIIAKVNRDKEIEQIRQKYGLKGSGYPADPETEEWLREWYEKNKKFPEIVRQSWENVREIKKRKFSLLSWLKHKS